MGRDGLTELEHLVMLSVIRLKEGAYAAGVRRDLAEAADRSLSAATIHVTLVRLERRGFLDSHRSDPEPVRGGRARCIFAVTRQGADALRTSRRLLDRMWSRLGKGAALPMLVLFLASSCGDVPQADAPVQSEVQLVGEGVVSTAADDLNAAFTPDMRTMYFTREVPNDRVAVILSAEVRDGGWSRPEIASFSGHHNDVDPFVTPDARRLLFSSNRAADGVGVVRTFDIWMVEALAGGGWGAARNLGAPINTEAQEYYPTVTRDGTLYFSSTRSGGLGSGDIYRSRYVEGRFLEPENLGDSINTASFDGDPYVAPDESYLIFTSYGRPDDLGRNGGRTGDLYLSLNRNGIWSKARRLDPPINSVSWDYCPIVSPDGRSFYFTSYRGLGDSLPVSFRDVTAFTRAIEGPLNGLGNVYRVEISALGLSRP